MIKKERLTITLRQDLIRQIDNTIDGKNIRNRSHAIESVLLEKFNWEFLRKAVILGGGRGIKISGKIISPLAVKIGKKTLLENHIEKLKKIGIEEIILAVGDFGDEIRAIIGDGSKFGVKTIYFERDYGTASVLRRAQSFLEESFLMINGHIILDEKVDLNDMLAFHRSGKGLCTIGLTTMPNPERYGQVILRGNNIVNFAEKSETKEKAVSFLINAGIYIAEPEVCKMVKPDEESLEKDIFPLLAEEKKLRGYLLGAPWGHLDASGKIKKNQSK